MTSQLSSGYGEDALDRLALAVLVAGQGGESVRPLEQTLRDRVAKQKPRTVPPGLAALEEMTARRR